MKQKKEKKPLVLEATMSGWRYGLNHYQTYPVAASKSNSESDLDLTLYSESLRAFQDSNLNLCEPVTPPGQFRLKPDTGNNYWFSRDTNRLLMLLFEMRLQFLVLNGSSIKEALTQINNGFIIPVIKREKKEDTL